MDSLAQKSGRDVAPKSLTGKLAEMVGLKVVGAQQAEDCLRRWLASRDVRCLDFFGFMAN